MEVMDMVMDELSSREAYLHEVYAPYYVCSFMMHAFNLKNRDNEIYWEGKKIPNMRLHIVFVAPPGFMKSYYLFTMGADQYSIFKNAGIDIGVEQSMTEAGFIGTVSNVNGFGVKQFGAAYDHADGLMLIDEFSGVTEALKAQYNTQMETQLLAALDHGNVVKRMGYGKIEYKTYTTLWAGVQPAKYDLAGGMGRRMCFLLFLPTRADNDALLYAMEKSRGMSPNIHDLDKMWFSMRKTIDQMENIKKIDFDSSVTSSNVKLGLASHESSYFDRLLIGWYLATYGPEKNITISADSKEAQMFIKQQKSWRKEITKGVDLTQLKSIIESCGAPINGKISISKPALIDECAMIGWNANQMNHILAELTTYGYVDVKNNIISIDDPDMMEF